LIEPLLPKKKKICPTKWSPIQILDGLLYQRITHLRLKRLALAEDGGGSYIA
jgi:hypothetical protein